MSIEFTMTNDEIAKAIQIYFEMLTTDFCDESTGVLIDLCGDNLRKDITKHLKVLLKVQKYRAETIITDSDMEGL